MLLSSVVSRRGDVVGRRCAGAGDVLHRLGMRFSRQSEIGQPHLFTCLAVTDLMMLTVTTDLSTTSLGFRRQVVTTHANADGYKRLSYILNNHLFNNNYSPSRLALTGKDYGRPSALPDTTATSTIIGIWQQHHGTRARAAV